MKKSNIKTLDEFKEIHYGKRGTKKRDKNFLKGNFVSVKENNKRNIAGYFGHLTEKWFDWDGLIEVAKIKSDWDFELIGHQEPKGLDLPNNIKLLGKMNHAEINKIASRWNVAIIIFKINGKRWFGNSI